MSAAIGSADTKVYFTADSSAAVSKQEVVTVKVINDNKDSYAAIVIDVPIASIKKVAVLTAAEVKEALNEAPKFTFTPTNENKQINGFNCKKVAAKETKSGSNIDVWVTNDISMPVNSLTKPFMAAGGIPVQFTTVQQGQTVNVELKSVSAEKVPAGTFGIPAGFDKISLSELKALGGR
jgi:D-alanyl-D-alanine carboxypeptidase